MILTRVDIEGYRSISKRVALHVEPNLTIVVGANDHGKSNLLAALLHLNPDAPFDADRDLAWDAAGKDKEQPNISYTLRLDEPERRQLLEKENQVRTASQDAVTTPQPGSSTPTPGETVTVFPLQLHEVPEFLTLERRGVGGDLDYVGFEAFDPATVDSFIETEVPRVELIRPWDKLSDAATQEEFAKDENEFMRGIFYYAGLDPEGSSTLFTQNDSTEMALARASERLNQTLKESWSQGKDLNFVLTHNSQLRAIELKLVDPAVQSRRVRVSRRSSGFTHYFGLKTVLHARQQEYQAKAYILLFDEPGIYLHPSGQFDLLQVLETLGQSNQIIYVTHSLFMINKTFPARHRLILKEPSGTTIEGKPYVGRWGGILSALGLSLAGTILFANYVLLTEGDSDPIYVYALFQRLVAAGVISIDLNAFGAMGTSDGRNADTLIRTLIEARPQPRIAMLFDGDKAGRDRLAELQALLDHHRIPSHILTDGTSIEDHLIRVEDLYVRAVAAYTRKLMITKGGGPAPDAEDLRRQFKASFDKRFDAGKVTKGTADWAAEAAKEVGGLTTAPSKVGIAREYALLLEETDDKALGKPGSRTLNLLQWIQRELAVPQILSVTEEILKG